MVAALAALAIPFSLAGCADGNDVLRINEVTHSVFYAPMYLADALGYYEDEGFEVDEVLVEDEDGNDEEDLIDARFAQRCCFFGPRGAAELFMQGALNVIYAPLEFLAPAGAVRLLLPSAH